VFKKIFLSLLILFAIAVSAIFIYRHKILQYSVQTLIRKALPVSKIPVLPPALPFKFKAERQERRFLRLSRNMNIILASYHTYIIA